MSVPVSGMEAHEPGHEWRVEVVDSLDVFVDVSSKFLENARLRKLKKRKEVREPVFVPLMT